MLLTERQIDFGAEGAGVAEDDKILQGFPKAEQFIAKSGFAKV